MTARDAEPERSPDRVPGPEARQTIEGSGNVALNVAEAVGGEFTVINVGDSQSGILHVGDVYQQFVPESQFQELSLDPYEPECWVDPQGAGRLVQLLVEHRLLFVAGALPDKQYCARHLALLLRRSLEPGRVLRVRERYQGKDPQRIEPALGGDSPAVLLLVDISPEQLTVDSPAKLRALLAEHQGYAIVTTESSPEEWGIDGGSFEARLWIELSWESYYGRDALIEFLLRKLDSVPKGLLLETDGGLELAGGVSLTTVVERLRSPAQVQHFAELLQRLGDHSPASIEEHLASLTGDDQAVLTWYRRFEPRDHLLILGLTLLDGMPEEIVFAGLELLVSSTWRGTDPLLAQFDYRDLPKVSTYFKTVASAGGAVKIQCMSPETRERILDVLWRHQRRRLLAALPALAHLLRWADRPAVIDTPSRSPAAEPPAGQPRSEPSIAAKPSKDDEKERGHHLSRSENQLLQQALVDSLSLIGRRSFEVVEPHFLDLLADRSEGLRRLAAKAIAGLREAGGTALVFERLRNWWAIACDYERTDPTLERISGRHRDPRAALRAGIALIVGFAAGLDRPNRLADELYRLLVVLASDSDRQVRSAVASTTLPWAVAWHFRQLEPLLRTRVLLSADLIPAVAWGAAEACRQRPEESLAILDGWRAAARADRRQTSPLPREHLLATVAFTCGLISCEPAQPALGPEAIGARLRSMLAEEHHPFVRRYVFHAIQLQAVRNFELVALILQDLISQVSLADRPAAVEVFVRTYLAQRERLPGGDARIAIGQQVFGVWTGSSRPLTEIEAALFSWVLDDRRPIAQQLAIDIFEALAETTLERAETRMRQGTPAVRPVAKPGLAAGAPVEQPQLHRLSLLGRMAVYLAAPRKRHVRALLRPLLAELLVVRRRTSALRAEFTSELLRPRVAGLPRLRAAALLDRWAGVANDATRAMARHLARALGFYRWRWGVVAAVLVTLVVGLVGGRALYQRMAEAYRSSSPMSEVEVEVGQETAEPLPPASEPEEAP